MGRIIVANRRGHQLVEWDADTQTEEAREGILEAERILREARRAPNRDADQTGTWSLTTLRRALRQAPDGLPTVSTATIWTVLHAAGFRWQRDRSWCETGTAVRERKHGTVTVHDPDAVAKKT